MLVTVPGLGGGGATWGDPGGQTGHTGFLAARRECSEFLFLLWLIDSGCVGRSASLYLSRGLHVLLGVLAAVGSTGLVWDLPSSSLTWSLACGAPSVRQPVAPAHPTHFRCLPSR